MSKKKSKKPAKKDNDIKNKPWKYFIFELSYIQDYKLSHLKITQTSQNRNNLSFLYEYDGGLVFFAICTVLKVGT